MKISRRPSVIPVWIHIRNIPLNHITMKAITWLGEFVGHVILVAFDPTKAQSRDYVRVKVRFDVSKPVRRTQVINIPSTGEEVTIRFDFESIQKRCFNCQRLTHQKEKCPLMMKLRREKKMGAKKNFQGSKLTLMKIIGGNDSLFGIVEEHQVGMDPTTGRERITKKCWKE